MPESMTAPTATAPPSATDLYALGLGPPGSARLHCQSRELRTDSTDLRLEGTVPVPRHLDLYLAVALSQHRLRPGPVPDIARPGDQPPVLLMAQVLGHLRAKPGLQHRLGQLLQQPAGLGGSPARRDEGGLLPLAGSPALGASTVRRT